MSMMDHWPELAQHALEVLACPVASVLFKRMFSAAGGGGGVITNRHICLSRDNVDRLTFIKDKTGLVSDEFHIPMVDFIV